MDWTHVGCPNCGLIPVELVRRVPPTIEALADVAAIKDLAVFCPSCAEVWGLEIRDGERVVDRTA